MTCALLATGHPLRGIALSIAKSADPRNQIGIDGARRIGQSIPMTAVARQACPLDGVEPREEVLAMLGPTGTCQRCRRGEYGEPIQGVGSAQSLLVECRPSRGVRILQPTCEGPSWRAVEIQGLLPTIERTFELSEIRQAYELQQSGRQFGKIVVRVP